MSNYEKLLAIPGVENCHPKFIAVVDGKREFVAEVVDEVVYLTDAGKKLLAEASADEAKAPRKARKAAVADAVAPDTSALDDLELGE